MNAPGNVTSPTVRVWSSGGISACTARSRQISRPASRGLSPIASPASYSPARVASSSSAPRPACAAAVMVPPMTMPETATMPAPSNGTT